MRHNIRLKIFLLIIAWSFASIGAMWAFHYPLVNTAEYERAVGAVEVEGDLMRDQLAYKLKNLKIDMEGLSLKLDAGVEWLDASTAYLKDQRHIEEVHLFNSDRLHDRAQAQVNRLVELELQTLEGLFFYQPMIVEQYDSERILVLYKGGTHYLVFLVNLKTFFEEDIQTAKGMKGVYDQHLVTIAESGEALNARAFFDKFKDNDQSYGYYDEAFYNVESTSFENMSFNLLMVKMDQSYKMAMRLYVVRFAIMAMVLTTLGFLLAWRIVKAYRRSIISANLSKLPEVNQMRKNLALAIEHMNMASKSFDDINILREELEMLHADLEEGVKYDKAEKTSGEGGK